MKQNKILITTLILFFSFGTNLVFSQSFWEPVTNITGYMSTEFNYFDELDGYENNYGTALSEAGILISYRPTSKLTLKGVFVYRPGFGFDEMLNETYGQLSLSSLLNFKVGRFLLPLSPTNTYYYAPVNISATLPILVSNHEFFPLNIDGVSINGSPGNNFKFKYDIFAGGFRNTLYLKTGAIGFFGDEVTYFSAKSGEAIVIDESFNNSYNIAGGGNIGFSYKSYIDAGFSYFKQANSTLPIGIDLPADALYPGSPATYMVSEFDYEKSTFGFNAKLQYNNTSLAGEYWNADLTLDEIEEVKVKGAFVILSHKINKLTPYVRYEQQETERVKYDRYTAGFNYKPGFERTLKLEYMLYDHSSGNINGIIGTFIYSF